MSFQLPRALLLKATRPAVRVAGRNVGRRAMSSAAHASQPKSDMPWIIGSTAIFGSAAVYLLSPPGKKKAHEAKEAALPEHKTPEPENAPVPTGDESETSPPESQPSEKSEATVSDDEGSQVPASEVTDSVNKALEEDAPKTAQDAEAHPDEKQESATGSDSAAEPSSSSNPDTAAGEVDKKDEEPKKEDSH